MAEYLEATEVYHDQEAVGDARKVVDVQLISLLGISPKLQSGRVTEAVVGFSL